ncbi:calcium-binding protein [Streptomyces mashuensis]|uniref:Calcium-binding protein n=1 Tax=Streptomyces mashuensis TaxID=33904 RepID=A0A919B3I5_9ACTN|nr:EF-hand domain-containing protein [Streptomyces mashuensis]GHF50166.1 calcium-binding protein [Streptomyces mashuensis]
MAGINEAEARTAFDRFDANGDGFITATEYKSAMAQLGDHFVTETMAQAIIDERDLDGDRLLSFEEFWTYLNR